MAPIRISGGPRARCWPHSPVAPSQYRWRPEAQILITAAPVTSGRAVVVEEGGGVRVVSACARDRVLRGGGVMQGVSQPAPLVGTREPGSTWRTPMRRFRKQRLDLVIPVAYLVAVSVVVIVTNRNFWYDETMLVAALHHDSWLWPSQPMSQYEQSVPYGVYVIQKASLSFFGFSENALRIGGLLAYWVGSLAVFTMCRRVLPTLPSLVAFFASAGIVEVAVQAGAFKHYVYEYAFAALIVSAAMKVYRDRFAPQALFRFLGISIVALLFSNTAVIVTVSVGLAAGLLLVWHERRSAIPVLVRLAAYGLAYVCVFAAWYVFVLRPGNAFQLDYPTYEESSVRSFADVLFWVVGSSVGKGPAVVVWWGIVVGAVLAVVWRAAPRSIVLFPLAFAIAIAAATVALYSGLAPFATARHILFLVPLLGLAVGVATGSMSSFAKRIPGIPGLSLRAILYGLCLILVFALASSGLRSATVKQEQLGEIGQALLGSCEVYWVDWWAQPTLQLYSERDGYADRVFGQVSTNSGHGLDAWAYRVREAPEEYVEAAESFVAENPGACVVTGARPDEYELLLAPLAREGIACNRIATPVTYAINPTFVYECAE